jgi:hypothetical protein
LRSQASPLGNVPSPSSRERARVREQGVTASGTARGWLGTGRHKALDLVEDSEGDELCGGESFLIGEAEDLDAVCAEVGVTLRVEGPPRPSRRRKTRAIRP